METVADVFRESVPSAFSFLADEHGYTIVREDDYAYTASCDHSDVVIELDWGAVVVSIRPRHTGRAVRLSFIVGAMDPEILFLPRYPWGPEEAQDEVDRQARLLAKYCRPILRGDFSRWGALEAHQQSVLDEWRRESERLVREARVKLIRRRAEAAFEAKDYQEAAQLYATIRGHLGEAELRRLDYAHRRTILTAVPRQRALEGLA